MYASTFHKHENDKWIKQVTYTFVPHQRSSLQDPAWPHMHPSPIDLILLIKGSYFVIVNHGLSFKLLQSVHADEESHPMVQLSALLPVTTSFR